MSQLHRISPDIEDPKADIVFVHGLGGDPFATWQGDDEPESCWARWLAADLPDVAVHSWAYNASKTAWFDRPLPLVQQGDGLLGGLLGAGLGVRPVVFVGHSMGGLVVKQMLRKLHDRDIPEWRGLQSQPIAVVFFGTPHRGANLADFLFRLGKYLGASASARDLQTHNGLLSDLNQWFGERAARREIVAHCFYETQPTKVVGMVVEQDSGDIGVPGVPSFPVDADHIGICKFANRDDHHFGYVVNVVRSVSKEIVHSSAAPADADSTRPVESPSAGQSAVVEGDRNRTIQITGSDNVIMVGDTAGASEPTSAKPDEPAFVDPLPMPADLDDFQARAEQVTALLDTLCGSGQVAITAIGGMGGIGKTALAVHVARRLDERGETPDGQRYLDRQGVSEKPLASVEAIGKLIQSFDPAARPPAEAEPAALALRQMLDGRRVLLLLDNAKGGDQIRWLLDGRTRVPSAKILVTSRQIVTGDGLASVQLDLMAPDEARAFLRKLLKDRTATDDELDRLAARCGHLPLALRVAGLFLQAHSTWSIQEYLDELAKAKIELRLEGDPNKDVKAVLGLSAQRLAEEDQSLAHRWQTLAVFPADFDRAAVASVWDCAEKEARDGLNDLVGRSMLDFDRASDRCRLHDLMREVAQLPLGDDALLAGCTEAAVERHARHYCGVLGKAEALYLEGGENGWTGLRLYDLEQHNIAAGQAWAVAQLEDSDDAARLAADFAASVNVLRLRLVSHKQIGWFEAQRVACRKLGARRGESIALSGLGTAYKNLGDTKRAIEHHEQALTIAREIGDRGARAPHSAIWDMRTQIWANHGGRSSTTSRRWRSCARSNTRGAKPTRSALSALSTRI